MAVQVRDSNVKRFLVYMHIQNQNQAEWGIDKDRLLVTAIKTGLYF